jgi:hypothetical protein
MRLTPPVSTAYNRAVYAFLSCRKNLANGGVHAAVKNVSGVYYDCKGYNKFTLYKFERRNIIQSFALVYLYGSSFKQVANESSLHIDRQYLYDIS